MSFWHTHSLWTLYWGVRWPARVARCEVHGVMFPAWQRVSSCVLMESSSAPRSPGSDMSLNTWPAMGPVQCRHHAGQTRSWRQASWPDGHVIPSRALNAAGLAFLAIRHVREWERSCGYVSVFVPFLFDCVFLSERARECVCVCVFARVVIHAYFFSVFAYQCFYMLEYVYLCSRARSCFFCVLCMCSCAISWTGPLLGPMISGKQLLHIISAVLYIAQPWFQESCFQ